ncbi:alpha-hydroxy acid oxidase [Sphingobium phenoxybenzoativorans]|uniref:alpha-hydroxy acid oxidase n=1 Tax=Sphingobium phenoxybenzoativorans TaxID=1592790 RepID=UPI0008731794|nr:alpha-hydroxy acid oxidase [Sphingobium phenoxybenzoativorans]
MTVKTDMQLDHCLSIEQVRRLAERRLPPPLFDSMSDGVGDGITYRHNIDDFEKVPLVPRALRNVDVHSTAVRVLGREISFPLILSPTGWQGILWPDGELAAARAAARGGIIYGLSCFANASIEDVASVGEGARLFQLYGLIDDYIMHDLVDRAAAAGYAALCVTVDTPVFSPLEKLERWRMTLDRRPPLGTTCHLLRRPAWLWRQRNMGAKKIPPIVRQFAERGHAFGEDGLNRVIRKDFTWDDLARLRQRWNGPFVVKGILNPEDARRAVEAGATAIVVCNHGGLSLDGSASSISMLPAIIDAVGDKAEILLGSGIRRGGAMVKALALGARATLSGRGYLFGLAASGEAGVDKVIEILRREFTTAMRVAGAADPAQLVRDMVRPC